MTHPAKVSAWACVALLLAFTSGVAHGDPTEAESKFAEKAAKTNGAIADALAKLGADCLKQGLNLAAIEHLNQALEYEPGHERAHKSLGHEKKKVEGEVKWEPDPKKAPPAQDAQGLKPEVRVEYRKARDKLYAEAAKELVLLGQAALKLGLEPHAKATFEVALRYNALNEDALKGAGWVKEAGDWVSPHEVLEREAARKALENPPDSKELEILPEWATGLGDAANPVTGSIAGNLTILASGGLHADYLRYAAAVRQLAARALGGESAAVTLFVARNRKQQQAYAATRHPANPGLAADAWCVEIGECAVEADEKDDKLSLERVVLAVATHEVRARCGEPNHPWFELGYATNLTRRLCGSVSQAPFSGKAGGPSEVGRWKRTLLMQVAEESQPRLEKLLAARDPDESQVIVAHFFTRYLLHERAGALEPFCAAVKAGDSMEDALKSGAQTEVPRLEQGFLGWLQRGG